jgi:hypothetical protein
MWDGLKILLYRCVHFEAPSLKNVLFPDFLSSLTFCNYFQNHKYLCVIRKVKKEDWPLAEPTSFGGCFNEKCYGLSSNGKRTQILSSFLRLFSFSSCLSFKLRCHSGHCTIARLLKVQFWAVNVVSIRMLLRKALRACLFNG